MINRINFLQNNINFKNAINDSEKINTSYEVQKKVNADTTKIEAASAAIGIGISAISQIASKNKNLSFKRGVGAYFSSLIILNIAKGLKNDKESKEFYKKYEQEEHYEGFDKFVSSISTPTKIDFNDEEKNNKYYKLAKNNNMKQNKINIVSLAIGAVSAGITTLACFVKKVPQKADKILCSALVATSIPLLAGNFAIIPLRKKEYENQNNI